MKQAPLLLMKGFAPGKPTTRDPRAQANQQAAAKRLSPIKMIFPVVLTCVVGSITYVIYSRYNVEHQVCVDCNQQREIMNQVYFGKKRVESEVPRF